MEKKVIVLGGIGNTDRMNRDAFRVIGGVGVMYTLTAHIEKDHPLVMKRYESKSNRSDGQLKG